MGMDDSFSVQQNIDGVEMKKVRRAEKMISSLGQGNTSGYNLQLEVPNNNAIADGTSSNIAEATLTSNGQGKANHAITFKITSGSATFSNEKQEIDNQMTDDNGRVKVPLFDSNGNTGDAGKIVSSMTVNPTVTSNDVSYSFDSIRKIQLFPAFDLAPADNKSQNRVLVALVDNASGKVDTSYSGSVVFTADDPNVTFVKPNTVSLTRGFADASFVYSVVDSAVRKVTVTATLSDGGAPAAQQEFSFNGGVYGFWCDYGGSGLVGTDVSINCAPAGDGAINIDLLMTLPAESKSYFIGQQTNPWVTVINDKVSKSSIGPASQPYGAVTITCDDEELWIVFCVSSPAYLSQTSVLSFTSTA